ncbi:hypothetical protein CAEBREN_22015 [Caenorhabditis brenneri]|uniref:DOCKER Lobe A domain-containing protein n=1 Tax=Caenorhabditis brenneri TaxID=135651 RepID=G0MJL8_CAEBE|nr:hypothetical protein CAEBREN_22015 [Caenorhabditis brenneri]
MRPIDVSPSGHYASCSGEWHLSPSFAQSFDTLAQLYEQDRWFAEASVCHAHSVAIIARELEEKKELEVDWRVFNWINNRIAETEQSLGEDAGNVQPAGFTTETLGAKIDKTAAALMLAERFEAVGPLYRLVVPVLEENMNFTSLVIVYAELQQTYSRAAELRGNLEPDGPSQLPRSATHILDMMGGVRN